MENQNNYGGYQNTFYNPKYQDSKPVIYPDSVGIEYNGYLIYRRSKDVYDVVIDGKCIGMFAGLNGAKKGIDEGRFKI